MRHVKLYVLLVVYLLSWGCGIDQSGLGYGEPCNPGAEEFCSELGDGSSTGQCQPGTRTCESNGIWSACLGEVVPEAERCEGADRMLDYDCDGTPANGCDCNAGEVQTCLIEGQMGVCRVGQQVCDGQTNWGDCAPLDGSGPEDEVCNLPFDAPEGDHWMYDEDCDGSVDEGFGKDRYYSDSDSDGFGINEIEVCQGQGKPEGYADEGRDCNDMDSAIYPGAADNTCDGVDNDCDGRTDEGFRGESTTCGQGACGGTGMIVCVEGELQDTCETGMPASRDQTCNGRDEDCDGRVDEDFTSQSTSCGRGECAATGSTSCENGMERDSCTAGTPANGDASCDGRDNDCDSRVDEDFNETNTNCGMGECAATGMNVCMGGMERNTCMPRDPSPDVCDGLDNDCDTRVDEGFSSTNTTCGMGACASTGMTQCTNGMEENTCEPSTPAEQDASCDNVDDDCDGRVDEDTTTITYQWDNDGDEHLEGSPAGDRIVTDCAMPTDTPAGGSASGRWMEQSDSQGVDCDDTDAQINSSARDLCGLDLDCNSSNDPWDFCPCRTDSGTHTSNCSCQQRQIGGTSYILCEASGNRGTGAARCGNIATIRDLGEDIRLAVVDTSAADVAIDSWMNEMIWGSGSDAVYSYGGAYFGLVCPGPGINRACHWECSGNPAPMAPDFLPPADCNEPNNYEGLIGRDHDESGKPSCGTGRRWSAVPNSNRGFLCQVFGANECMM